MKRKIKTKWYEFSKKKMNVEELRLLNRSFFRICLLEKGVGKEIQQDGYMPPDMLMSCQKSFKVQ